jgi:ADP-ribose pyrophosphatase
MALPDLPDGVPIRTDRSQVVWSCPWYRVRRDDIHLPDGSAGQYNVVEVGPCVFVVPVTAAGEVVLIRHYRHTLGEWVWELPAGGCKPGVSLQESAEMELAEETGGRAGRWQALGAFFTSNGFTNEVAHLFIAWGVVLGESDRESAEILTIHPVPATDALEMVRTNQLQDGPSALALLLAEPFLRQGMC